MQLNKSKKTQTPQNEIKQDKILFTSPYIMIKNNIQNVNVIEDQQKILWQLRSQINNLKQKEQITIKSLLNTVQKLEREFISKCQKIKYQQKKINQLRKQINKIQPQFKEKELIINQKFNQLLRQKKVVQDDLRKKLTAKQKKLFEQQLKQQKQSQQLKQVSQLLQQQKNKSQNYCLQIEQLNIEINRKQQIYKDYEIQLEESAKNTTQSINKINILQHELNMKDTRYLEKLMEVKKFQKKYKNVEQKLKKMLQQLENVNSQCRDLKRSCNQRSDQIKLSNKQIQQYKSKQQDTNLMIQNYTKEIERLQRFIQQLKRIQDLQSNNNALSYRNKIRELQNSLNKSNQTLILKCNQVSKLQHIISLNDLILT